VPDKKANGDPVGFFVPARQEPPRIENSNIRLPAGHRSDGFPRRALPLARLLDAFSAPAMHTSMDTAIPPVPPPPPAPPASDVRTWEMLAHLSALSGYVIPFGTFLGPYLVWQIKKDQFPAVENHAKAALKFQLSCLIYALIGLLLIIVGIGIFLLAALGAFSVVCVIIAAIKANNGEPWEYPLSLRFFK